VSAAVFGIIGVVVGGFIATSATYFMDRRRAWTEARAAGLQVISELAPVCEALKHKRLPSSELCARVWEQHRTALLFRPGTFPSGLKAAEWLELAESFNRLGRAGGCDGALLAARRDVARVLQILDVFKEDRPAMLVVFLKALHVYRRSPPVVRCE